MKLIKMNYSEVIEKCKMPEYQRKSDNRVNDIALYMKNKGEYKSLPIVINDNYEVIDGGHRLNAFIIAFEQYSIKDGIEVLVDSDANKETFLRLNMTKQVPFSHKVKIHKTIKYLKEKVNASFTTHKSTKLSLGTADFARALFILMGNKRILKQCSQKEAFEVLDNIQNVDLVNSYFRINRIKKIYINATNKKFLQKLLLYFVYVDNKIRLTEQDIIRTVNRFPSSMGGDICTTYNKELFLEAYNYRKKGSNRIGLEFFNKN